MYMKCAKVWGIRVYTIRILELYKHEYLYNACTHMSDPFGITPLTRAINYARPRTYAVYIPFGYILREGFIPRRGIKISLGFSDPGPRRGPASSNPRRGEVGEIFPPKGETLHAKPAHTRASTASERAPNRTYASSDASVCARGNAGACVYVCTSHVLAYACTRTRTRAVKYKHECSAPG